LGIPPGNFVPAPLSFAGLVGAGLYQINIAIPSNAPLGDLVVSSGIVNGPQANSLDVYLPIGQ